MEKAHQSILDIYRFRLRHYSERGIGNKSEISGTTITKQMLFTCLERYIELGGNLKEVQLNPNSKNAGSIAAEYNNIVLML